MTYLAREQAEPHMGAAHTRLWGSAGRRLRFRVPSQPAPFLRHPCACLSPEGSLISALKRGVGIRGCPFLLCGDLHLTWGTSPHSATVGTEISLCPHTSSSPCLCLGVSLTASPTGVFAMPVSISLSLSRRLLCSAHGSSFLPLRPHRPVFSRPQSWE